MSTKVVDLDSKKSIRKKRPEGRPIARLGGEQEAAKALE